MNKTIRILCVILGLCLLGAGAAYAVTNFDDYTQAGRLYQKAHSTDAGAQSAETAVVAEYHGKTLTREAVEYQKNMNFMRSEKAAEAYDTDQEVIRRIVEKWILLEEAERLGLTATQEEIEAMIDGARKAYALPEGKEMLDAYCEGAGITIEEYYAILREQVPDTITRQKLLDEIGRQYCEENGLEFSKFNSPAEMVEAQEAYVAELYAQHKDEVVYYIPWNE